jgi:TATA-box binding protein (TBP) (component of TFIID and TFIIIB)
MCRGQNIVSSCDLEIKLAFASYIMCRGQNIVSSCDLEIKLAFASYIMCRGQNIVSSCDLEIKLPSCKTKNSAPQLKDLIFFAFVQDVMEIKCYR